MRVKITGFTGMELWYRCKIGETFEVENSTTDGLYRVKDSNKHIKVDDATPIRETGLIGIEGERLAEEASKLYPDNETFPTRHAAYLAGFEKGRESEIDCLRELRDELYESIPTGKIDAFTLIRVINDHIKQLDSLITKIESNG